MMRIRQRIDRLILIYHLLERQGRQYTMEIGRLRFGEERQRELADGTVVGRMARVAGMRTGRSMFVLVMVQCLHYKEWHECHQ